MRQEHLAVTRHARLCLLGEAGPGVREVWIAVHGYGQLAGRFLRRFATLADGTRLIVAPEALNRFYVEGGMGPHGPETRVGGTWMTSEDRLVDIDDYVAYLDAVHDYAVRGLDRSAMRVVALGFSQGMSTIARWAARSAARVDDLILWAGSFPPEMDVRPDLFGGARLSLVYGTQDRYANEAMILGLVQRLQAGGIDPAIVRYPGGHEIEQATLRSLASPAASP